MLDKLTPNTENGESARIKINDTIDVVNNLTSSGNIYTDDGGLTSNRIVDTFSHELLFRTSGSNILTLSTDTFKIEGSSVFPGIEYEDDYSNNYNPRSLVDKSYVDSHSGSSSGLIYHDIGWSFQCRIDEPDYYGDIGKGAVDFSASDDFGEYGATGKFSFCTGYLNISSNADSFTCGSNNVNDGNNSFCSGSMNAVERGNSICGGYGNTVKGISSFITGYNNTSEQAYSSCMGHHLYANAPGVTVVGWYNESKTDTVFEVGMGGDRQSMNALEVYDDGRVFVPILHPGLITDDKSVINKQYLDTEIASVPDGDLKSDGSVYMDTGYYPNGTLAIATKEYVDHTFYPENITTTEYITGRKRAGNIIYGLEIDLGQLPASGGSIVVIPDYDSNYRYWIEQSNSYALSASGTCLPLPYYGNAATDIIDIFIDDLGRIIIEVGNDRTSYNGTVVVNYTK